MPADVRGMDPSETPLLAILVPTFSRVAYLSRLLRSLEREVAGRTDVAVLVADNGSTDATPEVLRAAEARNPWLRVHRQPENVGGRRNFEWLIEHAPPARHLWLFGDDDVLVPGGLAHVVDVLRAEEPAWLWLPHRWIDDAGQDIGGSPAPGRVERHADGTALFRARGHWLALISANVLRRELLQDAIRTVDSENAFLPLLWYVEAGAAGPCAEAAHHVVHEALTVSWADTRDLWLTEHFVDMYDEGICRTVSEEEFGTTLDRFYRGERWALEAWRNRPLAALVRAARRFPSSQVLRDYLWTIARADGDREALLASADEDRARRAEELVAAGEAAFGAGRVQEAVDAFRAACALAPLLPEAWNDLAVALHAVGHPDALRAVDNALFVAPGDPDALANRQALLAA